MVAKVCFGESFEPFQSLYLINWAEIVLPHDCPVSFPSPPSCASQCEKVAQIVDTPIVGSTNLMSTIRTVIAQGLSNFVQGPPLNHHFSVSGIAPLQEIVVHSFPTPPVFLPLLDHALVDGSGSHINPDSQGPQGPGIPLDCGHAARIVGGDSVTCTSTICPKIGQSHLCSPKQGFLGPGIDINLTSVRVGEAHVAPQDYPAFCVTLPGHNGANSIVSSVSTSPFHIPEGLLFPQDTLPISWYELGWTGAQNYLKRQFHSHKVGPERTPRKVQKCYRIDQTHPYRITKGRWVLRWPIGPLKVRLQKHLPIKQRQQPTKKRQQQHLGPHSDMLAAQSLDNAVVQIEAVQTAQEAHQSLIAPPQSTLCQKSVTLTLSQNLLEAPDTLVLLKIDNFCAAQNHWQSCRSVCTTTHQSPSFHLGAEKTCLIDKLTDYAFNFAKVAKSRMLWDRGKKPQCAQGGWLIMLHAWSTTGPPPCACCK